MNCFNILEIMISGYLISYQFPYALLRILLWVISWQILQIDILKLSQRLFDLIAFMPLGAIRVKKNFVITQSGMQSSWPGRPGRGSSSRAFKPWALAFLIHPITAGRDKLNSFATAVDFHPDNTNNKAAIRIPIHAPLISSASCSKASLVTSWCAICSGFIKTSIPHVA